MASIEPIVSVWSDLYIPPPYSTEAKRVKLERVGKTRDLITAAGALGQWIFVDPSLALAVAVTGENDETKWTAPVEFVYSHVSRRRPGEVPLSPSL